MGLTVYYKLKSGVEDAQAALQIVENMRQICVNLPFDKVGEVINLTDSALTDVYNDRAHPLAWLLIQAGAYIDVLPVGRSVDCQPQHLIAFEVRPGLGCEAANFGLCRFPRSVEYENDDGELAVVPTKLSGWSWSSFCKTQYASDPGSGGVDNFLRCHISLITALERMKRIPALRVRIDDDGKYGPGTYSDDYEEARKAGREPKYRRHGGKYSPSSLLKEIGEWNTLIAGVAGALKDNLDDTVCLESPITHYTNFEQLEFKDCQAGKLNGFLGLFRTK